MNQELEAHKNQFFQIAEELLQHISESLLTAEKEGYNADMLNQIFREMHTIKGTAGCYDLDAISSFTHYLEAILSSLHDGSISLNSDIVDVLLEGTDTVQEMLETYKRGKKPNLNDELIEKCKSISGSTKLFNDTIKNNLPKNISSKSSPNIIQIVLPDKWAIQFMEIQNTLFNMYRVTLQYTSEHLENGFDPLILLTNIYENSELYYAQSNTQTIPSINTFAPYHIYFNPTVYIATNLTKEELLDLAIDEELLIVDTFQPKPILTDENNKKSNNEISQQSNAINIHTDELHELNKHEVSFVQDLTDSSSDINSYASKSDQDSPTPPLHVHQTDSNITSQKTIRISEGNIQNLSDTIDELLILKNTYDFLIEQNHFQNILTTDELKQFHAHLQSLSKLVHSMQDGVVTLRMMQLHELFNRLTRIIRDIGRSVHKTIKFTFNDNGIEIDKKIGDRLFAPLATWVHFRCQFGMESTETRNQLGKSIESHVEISAFKQGKHIALHIIDDGKKIDFEALQEHEMHQVNTNPFAADHTSKSQLSVEELLFSKENNAIIQNKSVTEKHIALHEIHETIIHELQGTLEIVESSHQKTELHITIPTVSGIINSLIVESAGELYAFPIESIIATQSVFRENVFSLHDKLGIIYNKQIIPVQDFDVLINYETNEMHDNPDQIMDRKCKNFKFKEEQSIYVLILEVKNNRLGIIVDRFLKNLELTIKPTPPLMKQVKIIKGVSILGDGRVITLINPEELC